MYLILEISEKKLNFFKFFMEKCQKFVLVRLGRSWNAEMLYFECFKALYTLCKLFTYCKSIEAHGFFVILVFLATHRQTSELCVDCFVEIDMGGTHRMSYIKILSLKCVNLAQKISGSQNFSFLAFKGKPVGVAQISSYKGS
jgi:hypothetical protein